MTREEAIKELKYDICEICDSFILTVDGGDNCTRKECNIKTAIEALQQPTPEEIIESLRKKCG